MSNPPSLAARRTRELPLLLLALTVLGTAATAVLRHEPQDEEPRPAAQRAGATAARLERDPVLRREIIDTTAGSAAGALLEIARLPGWTSGLFGDLRSSACRPVCARGDAGLSLVRWETRDGAWRWIAAVPFSGAGPNMRVMIVRSLRDWRPETGEMAGAEAVTRATEIDVQGWSAVVRAEFANADVPSTDEKLRRWSERLLSSSTLRGELGGRR